jgi:iron complex outermembrane receptor protein
MSLSSRVSRLIGCCVLACAAALSFASGELSREIEFQVPSQRLSDAILKFSEQASVQVVTLGSNLSGLTSSGVSGKHRVEEALRLLLEGTGLTFNSVGGNTVSLVQDDQTASTEGPQTQERKGKAAALRLASANEAPGSRAASHSAQGDSSQRAGATSDEIETIIVKSEKLPEALDGGQIARGSRLGLLGNLDVMDTPFSTTNYTAQMMKDIGARSLTQVITSDPSVNFAGSTSRTYDGFEIRGFAFQSQSLTFDGMYGVAPPLQVAVETVERVELIKGPTALLSGMSPTGAIGGTVNLTPKRAREKPILDLTGTYYSDSELGAHVDMGRRFGADQQFGLRFNAVYRDGDLALEGNSRETIDAAIGLDFVRGGLRLTGDLGYQERNIKGVDADHYLAGGVTVLPDAPDASDAHFQPWSSQITDSTYGVARAEYEISPNALVYAAAGFGESKARLVASYAYPLEQDGDFVENYWGDAQDYESVSAEAGFRTVVRTGAVEHQIALAAMRLDREDGVVYVFDSSIVGGLPPTPSNLYSPTILPAPDALGTFPNIPKTSEAVLTSFALADTLSFAEGRTLLTLGARLQSVEVESFDSLGAVTTSYDEKATSPAAGLIFKARENISLYGNYSEGLSRGPTAPALSVNAGEVFPPFKTKQTEVGVKIDHGTFMNTLALFEIEQPSGITNPETMVFSLAGERVHRGLEINTFGAPARDVRLLGGVTFMDAELARTQGGFNDGHTPAGVSKFTASLGGEWDVPALHGLTLVLRGIYASSFFIDNSDGLEAPSRTTFDVGARYTSTAAGRALILRLNVENVSDEAYWNSFYLYRGAPRTVLLSATVGF